jgi:hypoxanthine phosphoribosyltransferase
MELPNGIDDDISDFEMSKFVLNNDKNDIFCGETTSHESCYDRKDPTDLEKKLAIEKNIERGAKPDIYDSIVALDRYIQENNISNVVLIDSSTRPVYVALKEYWGLKGINPKIQPKIYFLSANGFKNDTMSVDSALRELKEKQKKMLNEGYAQKEYDKDDGVLIVDVCTRTGNSISGIKEVIKGLGYKNIKCVVGHTHDKVHVPVDLILADYKGTCSPFGFSKNNEISVKQNKNSLFSSRSNAEYHLIKKSYDIIKKYVRERYNPQHL